MSTTITLPAAFTVNVVGNKGLTRTIESASIPADVWAKIVEYGLQQKVSDSAASNEKYPDAAAKAARVDDVIAGLKEGDWGRSRMTATVDTPERRAMKLALAQLQKTDEFKPAQLKLDGVMAKLKAEATRLAATDKYLKVAATQLELEATLKDFAPE